MVRFALFLASWLIGLLALAKLVFPIFISVGVDKGVVSLLIAILLTAWTAACTIIGASR
jgi:hypothetical protein